MESLRIIHGGLAQTGILFFVALGVWALWLRIRARPLDGSWYGAAATGELLMIVEFLLGWLLYGQEPGGNLARGFVHILYAAVSVITLPAAYLYLSRLRNENVKTILFAIICFFLMEVIIRARYVATWP